MQGAGQSQPEVTRGGCQGQQEEEGVQAGRGAGPRRWPAWQERSLLSNAGSPWPSAGNSCQERLLQEVA